MPRWILPLALAALATAAAAQNVKITSLGSHAGELCGRDRAMIFEDPTGLRILYDAGQTVTGADDPRLGALHVVLLSHVHGDHLGDQKLKAPDAGTCGNPELVSAAPNTTTAEIAAAKSAALIMSGPMANFVARKIENITGKATPACPQSGDELVAPFAASCGAFVHVGGMLSNGLTAYLTGDTALNADMKLVSGDVHRANLMVLNLGYTAITAQSGADAVNDLVRPASVIVTHVNEAGTTGGKVRPGSHTADFIGMVKGRAVYPALSGKTMEFDGSGKCVAGCA